MAEALRLLGAAGPRPGLRAAKAVLGAIGARPEHEP
jgi:hypothetical protein